MAIVAMDMEMEEVEAPTAIMEEVDLAMEVVILEIQELPLATPAILVLLDGENKKISIMESLNISMYFEKKNLKNFFDKNKIITK